MIQIDMPMPDNCLECRFNTSEFGYCNAMPVEFVGQVNDFEEDGKPEWCPLKAQEPVIPKKIQNTVGFWCECGFFLGLRGGVKYCAMCGRVVKWE